MADILQDFPIRVPPARVFGGISSPAGIDQWWTLRSSGHPAPGARYELDFGPGYAWRAVVTQCVPDAAFEWRLTEADADWTGTLVGFELAPAGSGTLVRFHHLGWPAANERESTRLCRLTPRTSCSQGSTRLPGLPRICSASRIKRT